MLSRYEPTLDRCSTKLDRYPPAFNRYTTFLNTTLKTSATHSPFRMNRFHFVDKCAIIE